MVDIQYFTVVEVAKKFAVRPYTVREWIREGKIKSSKHNGRHYIAEDDLRAFAEKNYGGTSG